eukprot:COSAG02_NODE_5666_length_4143_cov_6.233680_4_plen_122_part_00
MDSYLFSPMSIILPSRRSLPTQTVLSSVSMKLCLQQRKIGGTAYRLDCFVSTAHMQTDHSHRLLQHRGASLKALLINTSTACSQGHKTRLLAGLIKMLAKSPTGISSQRHRTINDLSMRAT